MTHVDPIGRLAVIGPTNRPSAMEKQTLRVGGLQSGERFRIRGGDAEAGQHAERVLGVLEKRMRAEQQ